MSVLSSLRARRSPGGGDAEPEASATTAVPAPRAPAPSAEPFAISPTQKTFFDTFGFLTLPGLFADDIDRITRGFEEVFEAERERTFDTAVPLHFEQKRSIIPAFITKSDDLRWLQDDPRTVAVVSGLIGGPYDYAESDGNLFYCDTSWHPDNYAAPMTRFHVKLSFYLDSLHGENGAIRMIPGTNHWETPFAQAVREAVYDPAAIESVLGVGPEGVPSWTLESEPGDLIVWNFRTVHGSFNGGQRRRLFSVNFSERVEPAS